MWVEQLNLSGIIIVCCTEINVVPQSLDTVWSAEYLKKTSLTVVNLHFQNVHIHIVDMSSARQVWEFAQNFVRSNAVHVLVSTLRPVSVNLQYKY